MIGRMPDWGDLPMRRQLSLLALIAAIGVWIGLLLFAWPQWLALSQLHRQNDEQLKLAAQQQAQLQKARARRNDERDAETAALPASDDIGELSMMLSSIAEAQNIRLRRIAPGEPIQTASHRQRPLNLKFDGDYSQMLRFIQNLNTAPRPLTVGALEIAADDNGLDLTRAPKLGVNLLLRSYCCEVSSETKTQAPTSSLPPLPPLPALSAPDVRPLKTEAERPAPSEAERTEVLPLRFAAVENIAAMLEQTFAKSDFAIGIDKRTNSLLLHGDATSRERIKHAIKLLDVPVRQVMIEGMIVISRLNDVAELGIDWTLNADENAADHDSTLNAALGGVLRAALQLGFVRDHARLKLELEAMQKRGEGEIVSRPRLVTGNRQSASIKSGTRIPFQESAPNGRTTLRFQDAVLRLDVVPIILPNDKIHLQLVINQDAPGNAVAVGDGAAPTIDTTQLRTQVVLEEGQTIALGGVFREEDTLSERRVPMLGALPLLGRLFRHNSRSRLKTETMIFITPYILPGE